MDIEMVTAAYSRMGRRCLWGLLLLGLLFGLTACDFLPLRLQDCRGHSFTLYRPPRRLVSLVPEVTDVLLELGCAEQLVGCTWHSRPPAGCELVGGFSAPSVARIAALKPDLVLASAWHCQQLTAELPVDCRVVTCETSSLASIVENLDWLGRIVGRRQAAGRLKARFNQGYSLLRRKIAQIPVAKRRRVMRLMGRNRLLVPGDDSFQNDLIRLAGGLPPVWGAKGQVQEISAVQVAEFDPQMIYNCGSRRDLEDFFSSPAWAGIAAVKGRNYYSFPCRLTCRPGLKAPDFAAWLAAELYPEFFDRSDNLVLPEKVIGRRSLTVTMPYVRQAEVVESRLFDFPQRTLLLDLKEPQKVLSTLEGWREGISTVGNHYLSPPTWNLVHRLGPGAFEKKLKVLLARESEGTALLFTGADMNNLVYREAVFKDLRVCALVTAGVCSNAMRSGAEPGYFYEYPPGKKAAEKPGTINVILLANARLSPRAMTRALLSACEGKSAALQDLDIRSAANPLFLSATGTGTDNIVVVEGRGPLLTRAGGHSRLGELIAKAVYDGVLAAIERQNGIRRDRNIFARLRERHLGLFSLVAESRAVEVVSKVELTARLGEWLMQPYYAAWLEKVLAVSDVWQAGRLKNLDAFREECYGLIDDLCQRRPKNWPALYRGRALPLPLQMAFDALLYAALDDDQAKALAPMGVKAGFQASGK